VAMISLLTLSTKRRRRRRRQPSLFISWNDIYINRNHLAMLLILMLSIEVSMMNSVAIVDAAPKTRLTWVNGELVTN
jgi:hypothetical protein